MAERDLSEQLEHALAAMRAANENSFALPSSPEVNALLRVAAAVHDRPAETFRARLKRDLIETAIKERETMTATETTTELRPWLREGFRSLTPYLLAPQSANLPDFMKSVFRATEIMRVLRPDGAIMHAEFKIGDSIVEMGENPPGENRLNKYPSRPTPLHVYVDDVDATYARGLAAGAKSLGEPADHEYGERGAGLLDAAGNQWWIAKGFTPEHTLGLRSVNVYLHIQNTSGYIEFLKRAFGAREEMRHEMEGRIAHARIWLGDTILEMGEAREPYGPMPCAFHFYVPDADATYARALAAGATSVDAPADAPYGDRAATVTDPQGNQWFIATHLRNAAS